MISSPLPFSVRPWQRTMKQGALPVLCMSVRRPVFPESGKAARVERYFAQLARQWITRWETILYPKACAACSAALEAGKAFPPWRAGLDFTLTLWQPSLLSLYLQAEESTGGPRPFLFRMGETWDCNSGYPRPLRSFFPARAGQWRAGLLRAAHDQAAERLASGESLLDADCGRLIDRFFDPERFYLTEGQAVIFYPLYTLGPYAEGIPTFSVPLDSQANGSSCASSTATR